MTDSHQLLADYARNRSETAFREIVVRYLDLVYSSALRIVDGDEHRARDVAQIVFIDLAKKAAELPPQIMLGGWLHRHTCFVAANMMRGERRRIIREKEAVEMNSLNENTGADASRLAPLLDGAINQLDDADRMAILLRFFEQKDFRSVAESLDSSEDAARMRVNRALDKLRDLLARKGIHTTVSALSMAVAANAVQAAPAGLAVTISTAALAGTAVISTVVAVTTKTIAMTTLQKTLITITVAVLAGAGIYEAHQAAQLHNQIQTLKQQQSPLADQAQQLQAELNQATNRFIGLLAENSRLKSNTNQNELMKLQRDVGALRQQAQAAKNAKADSESPLSTAREYLDRAKRNFDKRAFDAMFEDLNHAIELDPNSYEALKLRGLYYLQWPKAKYGPAQQVEDFSRCLELKPTDAELLSWRANGYIRMGQPDNAIADLTTYINGDMDGYYPDKNTAKADALVERGLAYEHQGNRNGVLKAIADYTKAIEMNPHVQNAYRRRGALYEDLGETAKAQQDFAIEPK